MELVLGFARAEEKYIGIATNRRDDAVIVNVELTGQGALLPVVCRDVMCFVAAFQRRIAAALRMLLDFREDEFGVLAVLGQCDNKCFAMINPDSGTVDHGLLPAGHEPQNCPLIR